MLPGSLRPRRGIGSDDWASTCSLTALNCERQLVSVRRVRSCSTSGCIRATAVDGLQHGFRVIVPRECVADRHPEPHAANLFDINSKYGDVVAKAEVLDYLARRPAGRVVRDGHAA